MIKCNSFYILPISLGGILSPLYIDYNIYTYQTIIITIVYFISFSILFNIFPNISKFLVTRPLYITDVEFNDTDLDEIIFLKNLQQDSGMKSLHSSENIKQKSDGNINIDSTYRFESINDVNISNLSQLKKFNNLIRLYIHSINFLLALFLSFIISYLLTQSIYKNRSWFELIGLIGGNISTFITLQSFLCKSILTCCGKLKNNYKEDYIIKISKNLEDSIIPPPPPSPTHLAIINTDVL